MIKHMIAVAAMLWLLLVAGCASTQLTLNLDLYKEDPAVALTPGRAAKLQLGLAAAQTEALPLAADRRDLADNLFKTYESLFKILTISAGNTYDQTQLNILRQYLEEYKNTVTGIANNITALVAEAQRKLNEYMKIPDDKSQAAKLAQVSVLRNSANVALELARLGGPLGTDFEGSLAGNWNDVAQSISADNLKPLFKDENTEPPEATELRDQVAKLATKLQELAARGRSMSKEISATLSEAVKSAELEPGKLKKSIDAVAKAATAIPSSIGLGDRGTTALNDLIRSTSLLFSQIDRLQDPADPVWRIVSDPQNESKWNTTFSETCFYSEGNNSVVVVRDTPMSFRVQRGNNNPTALIQGQLQVSRAIANAAISVAGTAAGIPTPKLSGSASQGKDSMGAGDPAEQLARRKATAERSAALRGEVIKGLQRQLTALRNEFAIVDPTNQKAVDALWSKFQSVLKAYDVMLTPPAPTLSVNNSPVTYNGNPQAATVSGSVAGTVSNVKYNGSSSVPTNAATYAVTADFAPTDTKNYNSLTGASAGNFVIQKATP